MAKYQTILAHLSRLLWAALMGALLLALAYQVPARHAVDIGGYDAAYVQGFHDAELYQSPDLAGSDGHARWTRDTSYLLFPQIGLPARLTLRLRGPRAATPVTILLNGSRQLGQLQVGTDWQEVSFVIDGGLRKPNDVVIELHSPAAPRSPEDPRPVGILVDRALLETDSLPLMPYPAQMIYGTLAVCLLALVLKPQRATPLTLLAASLILASAFLLLYRLQPAYPYPLRWLLPALDALLAALLVLRYGPALARRFPRLLDLAALGGIAIWTLAVLWAGRAHVVVSAPGVEKDFHVFATRSFALGDLFARDGVNTVLRADGFYNLGYPLLLWLARPLTADNPFLAAQVVAAISGALLLGATWWLVRQLLGPRLALLAVLMLALSAFVVEYALYLGTDMPFAALSTLALALIVPGGGRRLRLRLAAAGLAAGLAFLIRHPGLLLLPIGIVSLWWQARHQPQAEAPQARPWSQVAILAGAFLLAILPQLVVSASETGRPLYNQQAKNVWLAVYGNSDWSRWGEERDDVPLGEVVLRDPGRFFANWTANLRGYLGAGGEDTSEYGRALQLRYLGFPANWLAIVGVIWWCALVLRSLLAREPSPPSCTRWMALLLLWVILYVVGISVGLWHLRFFLPLAPVYALAAAWTIDRLIGVLERWTATRHSHTFAGDAPLAGSALILLALLLPSFATGTRYVVENQPGDEVAVIQLIERTAGEPILVCVPDRVSLGKYSVIAHRVVDERGCRDAATVRESGARYLLWSASLGTPPVGQEPVGGAGVYTLYRLG